MDNLEFKDQQVPDGQGDNSLRGVIKPKKELDDITITVIGLLTDYYNVLLQTKNLDAIKDVKQEIEKIKANPEYEPAVICLLLILILANDVNGGPLAALLRGIYNSYVVAGCEAYTAVSNLIAMYNLVYDENNNVRLEMKEEDEVEIELGEMPNE